MNEQEFRRSMKDHAQKFVAIGERFQRRWRITSICYSIASMLFSALNLLSPGAGFPPAVMCIFWAFHARYMARRTFQDSLRYRERVLNDMRETLIEDGFEP